MLTYAVGADKSGWDLTQVLRVPGTRNYKYPGAPRVRLLFADGPEYSPKVLMRKLRSLVPDRALESMAGVYKGEAEWKVPGAAKALLRTPHDQVVVGERSDRLWQLECMLVEARVPEEVIFDLVWPSAWNKHAEVHTGPEQLRREIRRAIRHVTAQRNGGVETETPAEGIDEEFEVARTFDPVGYSRFMSQPFPSPRWLVEDIWTAESHGIIGGEPKTSKSTLALALGLAVASGRPFLGRFPVHTTGPVLIVQEENSDWVMQDRLARIAASYGLIPRGRRHHEAVTDAGLLGSGTALVVDMPTDLDLWLVNHMGVDITDRNHQEALEADIERIAPVLVILDPLYLMLGSADENRANELRPVLSWLLQLRYEYKIALAVVHHFRKQREEMRVRSGQRLMGNATLHGWVESSLYMTAMESLDLDPAAVAVRVEPEMRNMAPRPAVDMVIRAGEPGDLRFAVELDGVDPFAELLEAVGDGITLNQLARRLGIDKRTARSRAEKAGCRLWKKEAPTAPWRINPPGGRNE